MSESFLEQTQSRSEEEHRLILEQTSLVETLEAMIVPAALFNNSTRCVYANRLFAEYRELEDQEEAVGKTPGALFLCPYAGEDGEGCGENEKCAVCDLRSILIEASAGGGPVQRTSAVSQQTGYIPSSSDLRITAGLIHVESSVFILAQIEDMEDRMRRNLLNRVFYHDIINTATWIRTTAQLLKIQADEHNRKDFESIETGVDVLCEEVESQRQLMKAESKEFSVSVEKTSQEEILQAVQKMYAPIAEINGCTLLLEPERSDRTFSSDFVLVRRIIGNLTKNAIEAAAEGAEIRLGAGETEARVTFQIKSPTPIPSDIQNSLFQKRISSKGETRGLGTYSVKLFTEDYLGGEVGFTTSPEEGTVFTVRFPFEFEEGIPDHPGK
ncbi:MAG: HAMP domain-containing histidine kinase [Spirochaetales bacterium]|nr:HAMP domain-containing histidine kinase [Spirochaetales bacterium]MCF7939941.1 HAMP domain-containing histidine kinase [Spirochaetales bacterium]